MPGVRFCLSVCLSVTALAATAFVSTCNERHLRHYYRLFLNFNSWIFEKAFRSNQYANKLELAANRFRALSGPTKHRDHLQDNLSVESCKLLVQPPRNKRFPRPQHARMRHHNACPGVLLVCHNLPPITQHFLPRVLHFHYIQHRRCRPT